MRGGQSSRTWGLALMLFIFQCLPLYACIWIAGTSKEGKRISVGGMTPAWSLRRSLKVDLPARGEKMERELHGATSFAGRNDLAVALIFKGDYIEAISLLEQLEREHPGDYFTAANLGAALELSGRNEEALNWINEGMHRNSDSHEGTEWLHAEILEAKIRAAKDPGYFSDHSVLNVDLSQIDRDTVNLIIDGQPRRLKNVKQALRYQLEERLMFVKTADPPVASLLFDYAAITAATHSLEAAKKLLAMAVEFGYSKDRVQPLTMKYDRLIHRAHIRQWLKFVFGALLLIVLLIYSMKRRWIVLRRA